MIKTLQKKFVVTAMIAVTALILLMLGAINAANIMMVRKDMERTLQMISDNDGTVGNLPPGDGEGPEQRPDRVPPDLSAREPKNDYDTFMSSNFFVVRFDSRGQVIYTDRSRSSAVSEEEAVELAIEVWGKTVTEGKIGRYRYRITKAKTAEGTTVVFLDTSAEIVSYIRVLLLSGGVGILCWGCMLLLLMLLSKKAIRPIAENIERQKQFVTNAGHEIKTPLAIIQSNTEAMELYNGENKWSRNIKEQTLRLSGLMNHLLLLSRMDEGAVPPQISEVDFSDRIAEALRSFESSMEEKSIRLEDRVKANIRIRADKGQIDQLLSILLDNAVKYTEEGGRVLVFLEEERKRVSLTVENSCLQKPNVAPEKLFDRFYRGDSARTQKTGGYGIGLSIAKALVSANQGTIGAEYTEEGHIRFILRFPAI